MIIFNSTRIEMLTVAQHVRNAINPYERAVALMDRRDVWPGSVVFVFKDGSTLAFRKVYEIEPAEES